MNLKEYHSKVYFPSRIDDAEKDSIVMALFVALQRAADILFPNGVYRSIKWWQVNRWIMLGKLMYDIIRKFMKS